MAVALPYVAMAMMAASTIQGMQAAQAQGKAAEDMANYNAAIAQRNAGIARQQAQTDVEAQQRDKDRRLGSIVAAYGASGVALEGSPLDVLEASAVEAEREKQNILYRGELRALGYFDEAALATMAGRNARARADATATNILLSGGSKMAFAGYSMWGGGGSTPGSDIGGLNSSAGAGDIFDYSGNYGVG